MILVGRVTVSVTGAWYAVDGGELPDPFRPPTRRLAPNYFDWGAPT